MDRDPNQIPVGIWFRMSELDAELFGVGISRLLTGSLIIVFACAPQAVGVYSTIPQELVNHIIDFFHDTPTDLKACALVSRAFVYAAQSHIFKKLSIRNYGPPISKTAATLLSRCQETLHTSPHLVQHRLTLYPRPMSLETFSAICNFTLSLPFAIALQRLFSPPTLRFVSLECLYGDPSTFMQIWDRCAPDLKHLGLRCSQTSTEVFHPTSHRWPAPIRPESFEAQVGRLCLPPDLLTSAERLCRRTPGTQ
ncbi:hypothetical protein DFH09DRAFT_1416188 [Mycena vulgaris]|nr:hypothetical protein DFH09DRAFT_1416188 [Mycena vulgaris]